MKKCGHCKETKEDSNFCKNKSRKDGLGDTCKNCDASMRKVLRVKNKDKIRKYKKAEYEKNKEKYNCRNMASYWANRDKRLIHNREYARKEENKAKARIRSQANKKKKRELIAAKKLILSDRERQKISAGYAITYALHAKKINRPKLCEKCHQKKDLQAHHPDYTKKLDVIWLCFHCHCHEHGKLLDVPV